MYAGESHGSGVQTMKPTPAQLRDIIEAARGKTRCDAVIRGGLVVNIFTGEMLQQDIGIKSGWIAVVGANGQEIEADQEIDATGLFLVPGFIDSHLHLESSMLVPVEFARAVVPLGTTAVILDPHEIANVAGTDGIAEMMRASANLPLKFYFTIPPAVPSTNIEASGARIEATDIAGFSHSPNVLGIAEEMDYPGVIKARQEILEKLTSMPGRPVDGHAPDVSGRDLQAYVAAGITSDHEVTNAWEGLEKLRMGMYLMIRDGSAAHNLDDLIGLADPLTVQRCMLVTDDLLPTDIQETGHLNALLAKAVRRGVSPVQALRMVTLNPAQRFGIERVGAIAPGYEADIVALEDLEDFRAAFVISGGEITAIDGDITVHMQPYEFARRMTNTVHPPRLRHEDLAIRAETGEARIIQAMDGQIFTRQILEQPAVIGEFVVSDTGRDILKMIVVDRHGRSGRVGLGLVNGFGLKSGAIAGSVSHDSHNIIAVGTNDTDIICAVNRVGEMNGGLVAVFEGAVMTELALPIGGLMSLEPAFVVAGLLRNLEAAAKGLGTAMEHPFATLSFMSLSVVPELKLTCAGLVDVNEFRIVPLFSGKRGETESFAAG